MGLFDRVSGGRKQSNMTLSPAEAFALDRIVSGSF